MRSRPAQPDHAVRRIVRLSLIALPLVLGSCSKIVFQPAPVVPTKSPLPYSAKVKLIQIDAYLVEPGATMIADPNLDNHVTGIADSLGPAKKEWEHSIMDYLAARKTFTYLSADSQTDLELAMRLNIYIDPGVQFKFNHVYVARAEATLSHPRTGGPTTYQGTGKAAGAVLRGGREDDRGPINVAVQSALNELFSKIENDPRLRR
jgi:hypothetical protein